MAILPWYDRKVEDGTFTRQQVRFIAACTYLNVLFCFILGAWLVRNVKKFLIGLKKYRVLPILTFYILSTLIVLTRFIMLIWWFPFFAKGELFFIHSPACLKFGLGLN